MRTLLAVATGLALLVAAVPADAAQSAPNFVSVCRYDHQLPDDPIVHPDEPGASHEHDFFANTTTDAFSTYDSLRAGTTTCRRTADTAAYWTPSLYDNGVRVAPRLVRAYYLTGGKRPQSIKPFPKGLKMVTPMNEHVQFACVANSTAPGPGQPTPPACPDGQFLVMRIQFPDCWDGRHTDSTDHRSHMAYSSHGKCPSGHKVPVPRIMLAARYPGAQGGNVTFDMGTQPHADFFNAWNQPTLAKLVKDCLNARVHCGATGS